CPFRDLWIRSGSRRPRGWKRGRCGGLPARPRPKASSGCSYGRTAHRRSCVPPLELARAPPKARRTLSAIPAQGAPGLVDVVLPAVSGFLADDFHDPGAVKVHRVIDFEVPRNRAHGFRPVLLSLDLPLFGWLTFERLTVLQELGGDGHVSLLRVCSSLHRMIVRTPTRTPRCSERASAIPSK